MCTSPAISADQLSALVLDTIRLQIRLSEDAGPVLSSVSEVPDYRYQLLLKSPDSQITKQEGDAGMQEKDN